MKKYLLKNPFLIILGSIICLVSCGPTEVSVDVEEVNIDTKLNTSINIPHSTPKTILQGNIQPPVVIPTPIGLEAMTEVLKSVSSVSENLQETAKTFGDIFSSLNTSTQITQPVFDYSEKIISLNNLLLIGFIVSKETSSKWNHTGLINSYAGQVNLNGEDRSIEVLIFDSVIQDPLFAGSVTSDMLQINGYSNHISSHQNLFVSCEKQEICEDLFKLLEEKTRLFDGK